MVTTQASSGTLHLQKVRVFRPRSEYPSQTSLWQAQTFLRNDERGQLDRPQPGTGSDDLRVRYLSFLPFTTEVASTLDSKTLSVWVRHLSFPSCFACFGGVGEAPKTPFFRDAIFSFHSNKWESYLRLGKISDWPVRSDHSLFIMPFVCLTFHLAIVNGESTCLTF